MNYKYSVKVSDAKIELASYVEESKLPPSGYATIDTTRRRLVNVHQMGRGWVMGRRAKFHRRYVESHGETVFADVAISAGRVTSFMHRTQKHTYLWDWSANKQIVTDNGWKYAAGEYKGTTGMREMQKALS